MIVGGGAVRVKGSPNTSPLPGGVRRRLTRACDPRRTQLDRSRRVVRGVVGDDRNGLPSDSPVAPRSLFLPLLLFLFSLLFPRAPLCSAPVASLNGKLAAFEPLHDRWAEPAVAIIIRLKGFYVKVGASAVTLPLFGSWRRSENGRFHGSRGGGQRCARGPVA